MFNKKLIFPWVIVSLVCSIGFVIYALLHKGLTGYITCDGTHISVSGFGAGSNPGGPCLAGVTRGVNHEVIALSFCIFVIVLILNGFLLLRVRKQMPTPTK